MKGLSILSALALSTSSALAAVIALDVDTPLVSVDASVETFPDAPYNGSVISQLTSGTSGFDGPRLDHVNDTAFDWWYFDVVSPDLKSSIAIVFFLATAGGFPLVPSATDVTSAYAWYSFPNGTTGNTGFIADGGATITTVDDGATGVWGESGFVGASDLSSYVITLNAPEVGLVGTMILNSTAPAHYPCGPNEADANLEVGPGIGWSNAIPDADGSVDILINGDALTFTGRGYHDKNWSAQNIFTNVGSWFWGHGIIGEYAFVWFDFLSTAGVEYVSGYASKNNAIVTSSCTAGSISVRPSGENSDYPPTLSSGWPGGLLIELDLGDEGTLVANVTTETITVAVGEVYARSLGSVEGSINGGETLTGYALYEEIKTQE